MSKIDVLDYDLELDRVCSRIKQSGHNRVLLQFPEGLKRVSMDVKEEIEKRTKAAVMISAEPCFGACDLPTDIKSLRFDFVVHFGHAQMPNLNYPWPIMFVEAHFKKDVLGVVKKAKSHLSDPVGLITTTQHVHNINEVKKTLEDLGFQVKVGKARGRVAHDGAVLGCNVSTALSISEDVKCFLFLGSGDFHPLAVAQATQKPVIVADPILNEARKIDELKERLLRIRHAIIETAGKAKRFAVIVSSKPGQERLNLALGLEKKLKDHGKKAMILIENNVQPDIAAAFDVEALVSTACPRIAMEDYKAYSKPLLTPSELLIMLGEKSWDDYSFDFLP